MTKTKPPRDFMHPDTSKMTFTMKNDVPSRARVGF